MRYVKQLAAKLAVVAVVVMMAGTSAFADWRHQGETHRDRDERRRDDSRRSVTMEGRIRSLDRDRNGYQVQLDRGQYRYFIPQSVVQSYSRGDRRRSDLRVGVTIRLTGLLDSRGYVYVSSANWRDDRRFYDHGYGDRRDYLRGVVRAIDERRGVMRVQERSTDRWVTVRIPARARHRSRGVDFDDVRRGDFVVLAGDWIGREVFESYRIESIRSGRY